MNKQQKLEEMSIEERAHELGSFPNEWEVKELSQVSEIEMGSSPKSEYYNAENNGLPFYQGNNEFGNRNPETKVWCSNPEKTAERGDILISVRAPVGDLNITKEECCIGRGLTAITAENINREYLFQHLIERQKWLKRISAGSTYDSINSSQLQSLNLRIPFVSEQGKIASVLYNVDWAIQKTEEIIEQTKRVKKGVIQDLFTEGYFDHERIVGVEELKTGSGSINTSLDETTIGKIPGSWECERLEEVTKDSSYGAAESAEDYDPEKLRYIRITDISETGLLKDEEKKSLSKKKAKKYLLKPGEILFARSGATVGKTFLYTEEDPEAVYGGYLIRFDPDRNIILPKFLFYYTQTTNYRKWVERVTRKGAQENINAREYSSILFPIPPIEEQKRIVDVIDKFYKKEKLENQLIENLNSLKKALMQDLLTGKVRTKDKPIEVLESILAGVKKTNADN